MSPLRLSALLSGLFVGSCTLIVQNLDENRLERCEDDQIQCDGNTKIECIDGLVKRTDCEVGELCNEGVGCELACGNGVIDDGEDCDGDDLNGASCTTETGFPNGDLACNDECLFDTSACFGCGDGIINDEDEECDDGNNNNFDGCNAACELEKPLACIPPSDVANLTDFCDGNDLKLKDCTDFGFVGGELDCNNQCGFNTDQCDR